MAISQWRLPEELGGAVVNPTEAVSPELVTMRRVKVPGTAWTVYVPAACLVPMLPEEPPVNSVVLVLGKLNNWQLYVRQPLGGRPGRWSAPGNSGVVHTWQEIHGTWDQVHVLVWWDEIVAEGGVTLPGGVHGFDIREPDEDEPGVAALRIADGLGKYAFLDRTSAIRAAAALLGLALKERM